MPNWSFRQICWTNRWHFNADVTYGIGGAQFFPGVQITFMFITCNLKTHIASCTDKLFILKGHSKTWKSEAITITAFSTYVQNFSTDMTTTGAFFDSWIIVYGVSKESACIYWSFLASFTLKLDGAHSIYAGISSKNKRLINQLQLKPVKFQVYFWGFQMSFVRRPQNDNKFLYLKGM